jgi:polyhydroxybutyrate depolymerase
MTSEPRPASRDGRITATLRRVAVLSTALVAGAAVLAGCGSGSAAPTSTAVPVAATVPASPSAGCATPDPPGTSTVPFTGAGLAGSYVRFVPTADARRPLPLIIDLHGYSEPAALQAGVSAWDTFATDHPLVAVAPEITRPVPLWNTSLTGGDLDWFGALLARVEATTCVDRNRVDVDGYSDGAFFTSAIVCRFASQVAAAAPVAGIQAPAGCHPSRPVPVIAFHGTADPYVAYGGGLGPKALQLPAPNGQGTLGQSGSASSGGLATRSIPAEAAAWARRNGCAPRPTVTAVAHGVALIRYRCPQRAAVELYRVDGGGHAWPGSEASRAIASYVGFTTFAIDADRLMWNFFQANPLQPPLGR